MRRFVASSLLVSAAFVVLGCSSSSTGGDPAGSDPGACMPTPPDAACVACLKSGCPTPYAALYSGADLPEFSACIETCETNCNPPAGCPSRCNGSSSAYADYIDLLYCGNLACQDVCSGTTVIF